MRSEAAGRATLAITSTKTQIQQRLRGLQGPGRPQEEHLRRGHRSLDRQPVAYGDRRRVDAGEFHLLGEFRRAADGAVTLQARRRPDRLRAGDRRRPGRRRSQIDPARHGRRIEGDRLPRPQRHRRPGRPGRSLGRSGPRRPQDQRPRRGHQRDCRQRHGVSCKSSTAS